jgi:hypothetical protein
VLIVAGILLVAGLTREPHRAPKVGISFGLLTGSFIAGYTVNDGWAVKVLAMSPFIIDFTGNLLRVLVLAPVAWQDRGAWRERHGSMRFPRLLSDLSATSWCCSLRAGNDRRNLLDGGVRSGRAQRAAAVGDH